MSQASIKWLVAAALAAGALVCVAQFGRDAGTSTALAAEPPARRESVRNAATVVGTPPATEQTIQRPADYVTTRDGVRLSYKDWGPRSGPVVTFSHGWPLSSDSWESQMIFLADKGYRVVAHDRRGHGRSSQPWTGNDMNHYADDLATVIETLDLKDVTLVGFSTGGGEVARYIGRHGTSRVKKAVLIGAVTPLMLKTADNLSGTPIEAYDGIRKRSIDNRAQLYHDIASTAFFGFNRPGAKVSEGLVHSLVPQGLQAGRHT